MATTASSIPFKIFPNQRNIYFHFMAGSTHPIPFHDRNVLFWILGKGFVMRLIKCTLGSGKPRVGWDFGGEGTREQWGTKGSSLQATRDQGGQFLSQLEGAK